MKQVIFIDGPLNGQVKELEDDATEFEFQQLKSFLPPLFDDYTYKELVPGYWQVVKTEIREMGF